MSKKMKGIRLNEEQLKWWENTSNAPNKVREFINEEIKREEEGINDTKKQIDDFNKEAINKLDQFIKLLKKDSKSENGIEEQSKKGKEAMNKVANFLNSDN